jgi:NAD(P)-dependent dehydrogenase (short-subunit alcohol dehydrogenase family)
MMDINLRSVFDLTQRCVEPLKAAKGAIVNVSSVTGTRAFPGVLSYCVSKAAVDQMTRCIALELADHGVRCNAVNPGVVRTNLHRNGGMTEEDYAAFVERSATTHASAGSDRRARGSRRADRIPRRRSLEVDHRRVHRGRWWSGADLRALNRG